MLGCSSEGSLGAQGSRLWSRLGWSVMLPPKNSSGSAEQDLDTGGWQKQPALQLSPLGRFMPGASVISLALFLGWD